MADSPPKVVEVKGILQQGLSLFGTMMRTVEELEPGQTLIVRSGFDPKPLISTMRRKGYQVSQAREGKLLVTTFTPGLLPPSALSGPTPQQAASIQGPEHRLDNRGLVPPEPMQRTLDLLGEVPVGDVVVIHNDRVPVFLLNQLDEQGLPYQVSAQADDSAVVRILKTHQI